MPLYKVTFTRLKPESLSFFVDDELDEMDSYDVSSEARFMLLGFLRANDQETAGWDDAEIKAVD